MSRWLLPHLALVIAALACPAQAHAEGVVPVAPATTVPAVPAPPTSAAVPAAAGAVVAIPPAIAARSGVIVIATANAASAARPLAREVYREAALRPSIDEATAQVLTGAPVAADAAPRLREIGELCGAALGGSSNDVVGRRLLASLGAELGAALVIVVSIDGGRPVGRVLRVATRAYEPIELGANAEIAPDGSRSFRWPGATGSLLPMIEAPVDRSAGPRPAAPAIPPPAVPKPSTPGAPIWQKGWFWGAVGGVAAVALAIFAVSKAGGPSETHLQGQVGP